MDDLHFYPEEITERELPPCEIEALEEILLQLKTTHPTVRLKTLRDLAADDGAYIVKLLDLFDVCELNDDDDNKAALHRLFDIFYALVELCDRRVIEILLSDANFLSVVGVFGHNPNLIRPMDFRTALERNDGYKEVIPIDDPLVRERVHLNFRIHVIKDNVLSRSLPDCSVIMLEHMVNENNFYILSYISDTNAYWQQLKELIQQRDAQVDGLGLLKELIQLVRVTRPLDKLPQQRQPFGAPPVFGTLLHNLFSDATLFDAFSVVLGSDESDRRAIELVVDILNILVFYQGPERLRTHLATEGRCIAAPTTDKDRITWTPGSSLFTALLVVFERYEATRGQLFTLLRELFKVPLGHDDKFLGVLYPNYITWLLQPMKYALRNDDATLFALPDCIVELLTFCTEAHGYRVKYLFGRQPIASYMEQMLRTKHKLSVIHAVKFVRACAARAEAFFSRFLMQNDLFTPLLAHLALGRRNDCAVSSAILELLAFIEKTNLSSLVEHIYTKFYATYKRACPLVFEALRLRYEDSFGSGAAPDPLSQSLVLDKIKFVQQQHHRMDADDDDDEMYWEKDDDELPPQPPLDTFVSPALVKSHSFEDDDSERDAKPLKLVDYNDDDDDEEEDENGSSDKEDGDPDSNNVTMAHSDTNNDSDGSDDSDTTQSRTSQQDGDNKNEDSYSSSAPATTPTKQTTDSATDDDDEHELQLPVRKSSDDDNDATSFFAGLAAQKTNKAAATAKKVRSPKVKSMFQSITWKHLDDSASSDNSNRSNSSKRNDDDDDDDDDDTDAPSSSAALVAKRKLELEDVAHSAESIVKKSKPGTPIVSSS